MAGESKLEAKFRKAVIEAGGRTYKFTSPANKGVSDRIVIVPPYGRVVFVELKDGNKDLSPLQKVFKRDVTALGAYHEKIGFIEEIQEFLRKYF